MSEGFRNPPLTCSFCGQTLNADAAFCPECGTPVDSKESATPTTNGAPNVPTTPHTPSQPEAANPVPTVSSAPTMNSVPQAGYAAPQAGYAAPQPVIQVAAPEPKRHTALIVVITVIITVIATIGFIVMAYLNDSSSQSSSQQPSSQQPQTQDPQSDGGSDSGGESSASASPTSVHEAAQYLKGLGYEPNLDTGPYDLQQLGYSGIDKDTYGVEYTDQSGDEGYLLEMTCPANKQNYLFQYMTSGDQQGWMRANEDATGGDGKVYTAVGECGQ